ncbi:hypothetical protein RHSIM_Rhsim09G0020500 [Rhododendron simsii]|uniref:Protein kinase domain-containing protein n=1 Tax=Rhododendron simsii TaxID=118357 RepID=A0A834GIH1_RHOSS|nr:hypothetical protein RHSIM_Rhsim09G0020500 [Rhododendron simsii]
MEQLDCNVVVIKRSGPKVLRLNLVGSPKTQSDVAILRPVSVAAAERVHDNSDPWNVIEVPKLTPASSPEHTLFTTTDVGASSLSSLDPATSPYFFSGMNWDIKQNVLLMTENPSLDEFDPDKEREELSSPSTSLCSHSWIADIVSSASEFPNPLAKNSQRPDAKGPTSFMSDALVGLELDRDLEIRTLSYRLDVNRSVREVILPSKNAPPEPPPLCSICQHKGPEFGKPPKWFTYIELEQATRGFSQANFLAEGGFGSVHRGVLPDGRVIAVK